MADCIVPTHSRHSSTRNKHRRVQIKLPTQPPTAPPIVPPTHPHPQASGFSGPPHANTPRPAPVSPPTAAPIPALTALSMLCESVQVPRRLHTLEEDGAWQRANLDTRDTRLS
jgi:hypothetical protein